MNDPKKEKQPKERVALALCVRKNIWHETIWK